MKLQAKITFRYGLGMIFSYVHSYHIVVRVDQAIAYSYDAQFVPIVAHELCFVTD